ncbi:MAG: hypothetical protein AAGG48_16280 [Planctomycetota bacterium]
MTNPETANKRRLRRVLTGVLVIAFLMSCGPGIALVNRPSFIWSIPWIYAWAWTWFLVITLVTVIAYRNFWSQTHDE